MSLLSGLGSQVRIAWKHKHLDIPWEDETLRSSSLLDIWATKHVHDWKELHFILMEVLINQDKPTQAWKLPLSCSGLVSAETSLTKRKKEGSAGADWGCPNSRVARLQCIEVAKTRASFPTQLPGEPAGVPAGPLWLAQEHNLVDAKVEIWDHIPFGVVTHSWLRSFCRFEGRLGGFWGWEQEGSGQSGKKELGETTGTGGLLVDYMEVYCSGNFLEPVRLTLVRIPGNGGYGDWVSCLLKPG